MCIWYWSVGGITNCDIYGSPTRLYNWVTKNAHWHCNESVLAHVFMEPGYDY